MAGAWLEPSIVSTVLGSGLSEALEVEPLAAACVAVRGWVEDNRPDLWVEDSVVSVPVADPGFVGDSVRVDFYSAEWVPTETTTVPFGGYGHLLQTAPIVVLQAGYSEALTAGSTYSVTFTYSRLGLGTLLLSNGGDGIALDAPSGYETTITFDVIADADGPGHLVQAVGFADVAVEWNYLFSGLTVTTRTGRMFEPTPTLTYGAALLTHRWYSRRRSPLGDAGDVVGDILRDDPDLSRMLGIGTRFAFGAPS